MPRRRSPDRPPPPRIPKQEGARPFCYRCRRAQSVCLCADLPALETRTRLVFLQHEDEAWNRIGSARLAHLSLPGSILIEGFAFDRSEALLRLLEEPGRSRAVLFPSRDARELEPRREGDPPLDLIVIDGTWSQAKGVVKATKLLRDLPRVKLPSGEKSRYRIRLQPRAECLSTVEAAVRALGVLEGPAERFDPLIAAFDRMIDRQIAAAVAAGRSVVPDVKARRARRPIPPELAGDLSRVVLAFGETLAFDLPSGERLINLVHWVAIRLSTREVLDLVIAPPRPIGEQEESYLRLSPGEVASGKSTTELLKLWDEFSRPDDVLVSWGYFATNVLGKLLGRHVEPLDLRAATKIVLNRRVRHPEDALLELDLAPPPPIARGRCGARVAALDSILTALREPRAKLPSIG